MRAAGVAAVYQELTTLPDMTAQANVFLGQQLSGYGYVKDREMRTRYVELCEELGIASFPDKRAGRMSVADQQLLEMMRALISNAKIILLDEPTASLAPHERNVMLNLMESLRDSGITIMFVSHNLDEVMRVADVITVFREGSITAHGPASETTKTEMIEAMLGRAYLEPTNRRTAPVPATETSRLRISDVTVKGAIENISLDLRPGEILGIGGLVGSGRTTLLNAIAGAVPVSAGEMWVDGGHIPWPRSPRAARSRGFVLLPEDRKTQGLIPDRNGAENILVSDLPAVARFGIVNRRAFMAAAETSARGFGVAPEALLKKASQLSGGNQQKLLLARCAHSGPTVLLADEPTRGIDIGAKAEIVERLNDLATAGLSIIFVSSELDEVAAISHRIVVLAEGRMLGVLDNSKGDVDEKVILHTIFNSTGGGRES